MKLNRTQLKQIIKEAISDIQKTTVTDSAVFEDPGMIMDQFQKLSASMSIMHDNAKMTYDKIASIEARLKIVEDILGVKES